MADNNPVDIDPKEQERSVAMWQDFTKLTKYSIIATVVVLVLLGLIFIDW